MKFLPTKPFNSCSTNGSISQRAREFEKVAQWGFFLKLRHTADKKL